MLAGMATVYAWRRRRVRGAWPLSGLMLAVVVWCLAYALELSSQALAMQVFWAKIQYLGIVWVSLLFFIMIIQYTGRESWLTGPRVAALLVVPLTILGLAWTNEWHGLIWQRVGQIREISVSVLALQHGPFFWVFLVYSYVLLLFACILLVRMFLRSSLLYRAQLRILIFGASVPWIGNAIYVMDLSPFPYLDLTPFMFAFAGIAAFWGLFRHQFLDMVPVARDMIIDGIADGVLVLDERGRIIDLNPTARQFIGERSQRLIGLSIEQLGREWARLRPVLQAGRKAAQEMMLGSGENLRFYDVSVSPLRSRQGHLHGYTLIIYDTTSRKRSEQAFRESEERYRKLVELSPEAVIVHSAGTFIYANPAGLQLFGANSLSDLAEKAWIDLVDPSDQAAARRRVEQMQAQQSVAPLQEYRLRRLDGDVFDAEVAAVVINYEDRPATQVLIRDISARKEADEELRRSMGALELRNDELNAFAHTVAHDLKNPLATFINFIQLLQLDIDQGIEIEQLRQYVRVLDRNSQKMHNIINELLLLASVRNEHELLIQPVDMDQVVHEAIGRLSFMIESYQASISMPAQWPVGLGYGPWIEEVWVNYLSNALKYGGRPPVVELGADIAGEGMIRYWVRDNGAGLSAEDQERIFTPFERLHQVRAEGHGLGLSIVRRIIEKLGGQVGVESRPGQGSTFYFVLPAAANIVQRDPEMMRERAI